MEQEPEHVIHSAAQMKALSDAFPGRLLLTFDVGHSHVLGEDIGAALRDLGPRLANMHLEDIRGRVHAHKLYGDGDVDFAAVFAALHDIGYRGDYTPDLYPFKDDYRAAMRGFRGFPEPAWRADRAALKPKKSGWGACALLFKRSR